LRGKFQLPHLRNIAQFPRLLVRQQVDYYRAGNVWLLFEGDHMVGVTKR
jgi:hypothetical protein